MHRSVREDGGDAMTAETPTLSITHEYPGILVIHGAHGGGDVGIDADALKRAPQIA